MAGPCAKCGMHALWQYLPSGCATETRGRMGLLTVMH